MADIRYGKFAGINNKEPAYRLRDDELTVAINADIDNTGKLSRRDGANRIYTGDCHSLFADGDICLFRSGSGLYRLFPDYSAKLLKTGLTGRTVYHAMPGRIYFSDGSFSGFTDGERVTKWGIDAPTRQPIAAALVDGRLPSGRYQYALTYLRADSSESGTLLPGVIEAAKGLYFTQIPVSGDTSVTRKVIYLSRPNGETLFHALVLPNAQTAASYTGNATDFGAHLETLAYIAAPGATHIAHYNGRMLLAFDRFLLYSAPYRHESFRRAFSYAFRSRVTLVAPVSDGVYVGDESSITFLQGDDIASARAWQKTAYGALDQTPVYAEGKHVLQGYSAPVAVFATALGVCIGASGGAFVNLSDDRYVMPDVAEAAGMVRNVKNFIQYLSILR